MFKIEIWFQIRNFRFKNENNEMKNVESSTKLVVYSSLKVTYLDEFLFVCPSIINNTVALDAFL